jgi:hypothetical protein
LPPPPHKETLAYRKPLREDTTQRDQNLKQQNSDGNGGLRKQIQAHVKFLKSKGWWWWPHGGAIRQEEEIKEYK